MIEIKSKGLFSCFIVRLQKDNKWSQQIYSIFNTVRVKNIKKQANLKLKVEILKQYIDIHTDSSHHHCFKVHIITTKMKHKILSKALVALSFETGLSESMM